MWGHTDIEITSVMEKDLVIGAAVGYHWKDVRNFVLTLRNTGYSGDICLLMDKISQSDKVEFQKHNVIIRTTHRYLDFLPAYVGKKRFTRFLNPVHQLVIFFLSHLPITHSRRIYFLGRYTSFFLSPACSRYFYYYDFMKGRKYGSVLLADVKDVVFQDNPFLKPLSKLQVAIENTQLTLATEPCNERWIKIIYSESMLNEIGHENISCSGTTMGDNKSIQLYLLKMIEETARQTNTIAGSFGFDQGIHNYLLRHNAFGEVDYNLNCKGLFLTMLSESEDKFIMKDGYFYNENGKLVPVIHQYNWFPKINLRVIEAIQ
jgi:hypothetical protein